MRRYIKYFSQFLCTPTQPPAIQRMAEMFEWRKWHIVLPLSVRPSFSVHEMALVTCILVSQELAIWVYVFQAGAFVSFGHIFSFK